MNHHCDVKNMLLAAFSGFPTYLAAVETQTLITIVASIVLPCLFFLVGKAIDVGLQIYLRRDNEEDNEDQ